MKPETVNAVLAAREITQQKENGLAVRLES